LCDLIDGYDFYKKDLDTKYIIGENIPVIKNGNSNITYAKNLKKYNKYICKKSDLLICTMGTLCVKINIFDIAYHGHHIYRVSPKISINILYLYYYINNNMDKIKTLSNGSVVKGISKSTLENIKIPIPRNKTLIQNLETDFKQIETLQREIKDSESEYKRVLQELADDIKPSTNQETKALESKVVIKDGSDTEIQDIELKENNSDMEQPRRKNKKKKKKKKHKKTLSVMENSEEEPDIRVVSKKKRKKKVVKRKS